MTIKKDTIQWNNGKFRTLQPKKYHQIKCQNSFSWSVHQLFVLVCVLLQNFARIGDFSVIKCYFHHERKIFFIQNIFFFFRFLFFHFFWTHREHQTGLIVSFSVTFKLVFLSHLFYWVGTYFRKRSQPLSFLRGLFCFFSFFLFLSFHSSYIPWPWDNIIFFLRFFFF